MELLNSYKKVIEFFQHKSYLGIWGGEEAIKRKHTFNYTTIFSIYVLYKTYFYLLNLLKVS